MYRRNRRSLRATGEQEIQAKDDEEPGEQSGVTIGSQAEESLGVSDQERQSGGDAEAPQLRRTTRVVRPPIRFGFEPADTKGDVTT